jgi:hypothetical protein
MVGHVTALFSGERPAQSASLPNEALVQGRAGVPEQQHVDQRVYERAKAAMLPEAPQEFTLVRAVGPQAGTVFSRAGGLPLEKGVPGLFTYDGYHELFNKRLPEFVGQALDDDAWVMGRAGAGFARTGDKKAVVLLDEAVRKQQNDPLLEDIRRQYLTEYARHWESFLESVRTVSGSDTTGTSLGFDLNVLRQFAAPDSPLARLVRAAARETTLSRSLVVRASEEKGFLDKATDELNKQANAIGRGLGIRAEERLEKQIVDNRFAALREVVTGQADIGAGNAGAAGGKPGLETISGLVNEFYTLLVVADTALSAGSLPPGGAEVGSRLKLEAGKLPAPFREVLTALASSGSDKVVQGSAGILRNQAQVQLDRLMGLMAMQVSEPCKRGVEGRYPLAAVAQDASIEDFALVFAVGGAADEFFNKYLASYVDTSVRPWRYKDPNTANAIAVADGAAAGTAPAPATTGPTLLGNCSSCWRKAVRTSMRFIGHSRFATCSSATRVARSLPGRWTCACSNSNRASPTWSSTSMDRGNAMFTGLCRPFRSTGRVRAVGRWRRSLPIRASRGDLEHAGHRAMGALSAARKGAHREHRDARALERRIHVRRTQGAGRHQLGQSAQSSRQRRAQRISLPWQGCLNMWAELLDGWRITPPASGASCRTRLILFAAACAAESGRLGPHG